MAKQAIGIDIGGTGIKGALVDVKKGDLVSERIKYPTPEGGEPEAIAKVVAKIVSEIGAEENLPIGICFPSVVIDGRTMSAANVSKRWINFDAGKMFTKTLGRPISIMNDADAAGYAEIRHGAGKDQEGLVIMTTLGTGIGSALFMNGKLVPNAELGHLEIDGEDYETKASFAAKERENLDYTQWAKRLQRYYETLEKLFSPRLIIVGGGVSKYHEEFLPLIKLRADIVPAKKRNSAGIIGAASLAFAEQK